jgi:hypothetical protein
MSQSVNHIMFWVRVAILAVVVLFFLVMGGLLLAIFLACLWEKQRIRDWIPAAADSLPPASPYFQAMNDAAQALGFQCAGFFRQNRQGKMYCCCMSLWVSPDLKTILCIVGGKVAGKNYRRAMLISRLPAQESILSMDEFGSADLSGICQIEVLLNADLPELVEMHNRRLAQPRVEATSFAPVNLPEELFAWNRTRADKLAQLGLAKYLSQDRDVWKYTLNGAVAMVRKLQIFDSARMQTNMDRLKKKRPGS